MVCFLRFVLVVTTLISIMHRHASCKLHAVWIYFSQSFNVLIIDASDAKHMHAWFKVKLQNPWGLAMESIIISV